MSTNLRSIGALLLALSAVAAMPALAQDAARAREQFAQGEHAAAAAEWEARLEVNPFDPADLNNLAVAKAAQGDYPSARELLQRAVRLAPDREDIAANLARLADWMDRQRDGIAPAGAHPALREPGARVVPPEPPAPWPRRAATRGQR
jgi:tetratricopeptide (TPR) repeat protein